MSSRKDMPSKAAIADYWKDKELPNGYPVIVDWYEPSCWACGQWGNNKEEGKMIKKGDFNGLWNHPAYNLERCHIIPRAIGGSDDVDNLFLMCHWCHQSSPDTSNPEYFFDWVMKRTNYDMIKETPYYHAFQELLHRGYEREVIYEFMDNVTFSDIKLNINSHGLKISDSTIKYAFVDTFLKRQEGELID